SAGRRAGSARLSMVLERPVRRTGPRVPVSATVTASRVAATTVPVVGGLTVLSNPALGSASSGAVRHPTVTPAAAAATVRSRYCASSSAATVRGVAPTALRRLARRWSRGARTAASEARVTSEAAASSPAPMTRRSEEHTSELQSRENLVCRLLLEKKYDK